MKNNQMKKFLDYIIENKNTLYLEFQKREEVQALLNTEKVKTFFQPILTLDKGTTIAYEILNRPESSTLFPTTDKFYEYVGKSSCALQVEHFLCNLALSRFTNQIKSLKAQKDILVFLNIQPQVLGDVYYQRDILLNLLDNYQLTPNQIVLELTERDAGINHEQFIPIIEYYREKGLRIALDDAGTGYNSLQTLLYLNPEFIKIDKSLIRNIEEHHEKQYLVELIIEFASKSNTKVIAEGIEKISELSYLQQLGVEMGQGYALGRPMPQVYKRILPDTKNVANQLTLDLY